MLGTSKRGLVVFDLDGVLIDSKDIHYEALNQAISRIDPRFCITPQEHATTFDGLSTNKKLEMLNAQKGLPRDHFSQIWSDKQDITLQLFGEVVRDEQLVSYMKHLKEEFFLAVASNSIRNTVDIVLKRLGIFDVKFPKPHPEIYWRCMMHFGVLPNRTAVFEDSHIGRQAAINSGANLVPIERRSDLTWEKIRFAENDLSKETKVSQPWKSEKLNVLIPMAGAGSRFETAGYTFPKPLIEVRGKPMIQVVVDNLNVEANFIFIVQKSHFEKYNLEYLLRLIAPDCKIVQIEGITEGAACTTLLASDLIDNSNPLLIANSDQFVEWNSSETIYSFESDGVSGGIVTFEATHPKWSYVKLGEDGFVSEVAEKKPISNMATVGIYYWRKGADYVKYAMQMIDKDIRTNGEFYVCPVFNEAIQDGLKFRIRNASRMWGIGTPEDLNFFLENYGGSV
jgi:beta-phosphoglucomutase-like phosphatase (HAD superfamily)/dTDP-glucose pyrophosphorylase